MTACVRWCARAIQQVHFALVSGRWSAGVNRVHFVLGLIATEIGIIGIGLATCIAYAQLSPTLKFDAWALTHPRVMTCACLIEEGSYCASFHLQDGAYANVFNNGQSYEQLFNVAYNSTWDAMWRIPTFAEETVEALVTVPNVSLCDLPSYQAFFE